MNPLDRFRLDGKTALVTGASSGIGAELARGLAMSGAYVFATARRAERLEALVAEIRAAGGKADAIVMDVTNRDSIRVAFDRAEELGNGVDVLVNNAGIADPRKFVATTPESRDATFDTNFFGVWDLCHEAARRLIAAKRGGSLINIASILGIGAAPGYAAYSASKAAVIQFTRVLALELGRQGIRVNAIAPGWFVTEMNSAYFATEVGKAAAARTPAGRTGTLSELVGPVLLLASDAGSFVNGVVLPVDGANAAALVG